MLFLFVMPSLILAQELEISDPETQSVDKYESDSSAEIESLQKIQTKDLIPKRELELNLVDRKSNIKNIWHGVLGFILGTADSLIENNTGVDLNRSNGFTYDYGRFTGDILSVIQGVVESVSGATLVLGGGGLDLGGGTLCSTGVGCLAGAPAIVIGLGVIAVATGVTTHGILLTINGGKSLVATVKKSYSIVASKVNGNDYLRVGQGYLNKGALEKHFRISIGGRKSFIHAHLHKANILKPWKWIQKFGNYTNYD